MPSEAQARRVDEVQPARGGSVTLGLVAAPDIPEKVARELCEELPELLSREIDNRVSWKVSVVVDPLTGSERNAPEILDECRDRMRQEGWDLAICLTDLPVYRSGGLVVADASAARKVGGISLPALGATRLRLQTRQVVLQLVEELYVRIPELGKDAPAPDGDNGRGKAPGLTGERPNRMVKHPRMELVAPFRRVEPPDDSMKAMRIDARFVAPKAQEYPRLLSGMVLANRPWKLFPSFRSTIAAAFATGAYVLVTSSIWALADSYGWERLLILTVSSITAMVVWIIVAHGLWERDRESRKWMALYNAATALTMTVAVLLAHAALFVLILLAALIFVEEGYFQSTLQHPVDFGDYMSLVWMATSLATVAGALGSSLEDEGMVRKATYGYRQQQRNEEAEEAT